MASLSDLIESAYKRDGSGGGETMIVANHLQQMKEFGRRKGVEFYPAQDDEQATRFNFIKGIFEDNKIDLYLDRFWDILLCKGQILFYLRPTGDSYKIYWYPKDSFKAYYDGEGELVEVVILYSYKVKAPMSTTYDNEKWLKLKITKDKIWRTESDQPLSLESELEVFGINTEETVNSLGFIPCVVCNNYVLGPGQDGIDDFSWLKNQIESLDMMQSSVKQNLEFFANPILVATRSPGELVEAGVSAAAPQRPSISSNSGFYSQTYGSTRKQDPETRSIYSGGVKLRKVIGNVRPEERFGFVSSDAVSGDHNQHIAITREAIRTALGGVDELGISSGATAFEIKSLYGRAAATAHRKCLNLYTYGLCKIFEMAILSEESLFRQSLAQILEQGYAKQIKLKLDKNIPVIEQVNDDLINYLMQNDLMPQGTIGLTPNGLSTVLWRYMGPVFEDSPQDKVQQSIMVRNLQELGVASPEALKVLFPEKTESERMEMLSGLPFRMGGNIVNMINQILQLMMQLSQMPDPYDFNAPLSNRIDISPMLEKCVSSLLTELSYGKKYDPATKQPILPSAGERGDDAPVSIDGTSSAGALDIAAPISPGFGSSASAYWGTDDPLYAASYGYPVVSADSAMAQPTSARYGYAIPEYASPLPTPGGTVGATIPNGLEPRVSAIQLQPTAPVNAAPIPPDLAIQPSLVDTLFPTFSAMARAATGKKRGKPKK